MDSPIDASFSSSLPTVIVFVLVALIVMPHRVHAPSSAFTMAYSSLADSATRVRSSAYWMFWMSVVHGVFSLYDKNSPSGVM